MRISGGLVKAVNRAAERGCETMQIFASNPRSWTHSEISPRDISMFRSGCGERGLSPVFVHSPYLVNLAAPVECTWGRSIEALTKNVEAAEALGASAVVTHLGSHGGMGEDFGIGRVIRALEKVLSDCHECVPVLLETTAGSGKSVGHTFTQLGEILEAFEGEDLLGLCFDTCHAFAAGYELRYPPGIEETLEELDREVGLERLRLIHANDSKGDRGSRVDRHQDIGEGYLGLEAFEYLVNHPAMRHLPWILETPHMTLEKDRRNLCLLRSLARGL
ncbi:MAG: deoxyribonuclease IV [Actinomycetota bacterium]|nr:deoxyribonuclease IV [Actinomycetota bacterium]